MNVMWSSKRVVVAGVAFLLPVAFGAGASHAQRDRDDAQTKKIRIVTVVKRTGLVGGSGRYVAFVGQTTARSHMRWAGAAYERAKEKYPKIERISDPVETTRTWKSRIGKRRSS